MFARKLTVLVASAATIAATAVVVAPTADAKPKAKAPARVSKVRTSTVTNAASLSWKNPKSKNFKGTIVRIAAGTKAPKTIKSGHSVGKVSKKKHAVRIARLAPNTTYTVSLFSSGGGKLASKPVAVRIRTKALPPVNTAPSPVAPVTGVKVIFADGVATISWTPPNISNFNGVLIFRAGGKTIQARRVAAVAGTQIADLPKGVNSFADTQIQPGTTYTYSVVSKGTGGNTAAASSPSTPTTTAKGASQVSGFTATPGDPPTTSVDLAWTNPIDAAYVGVRIVRKDGSLPTSPNDGDVVDDIDADSDFPESTTDYDVAHGKTYGYALYAYNAQGVLTTDSPATQLVTTAPAGSLSGTVLGAGTTVLGEGATVSIFNSTGDEMDRVDVDATDGTYSADNLPAGNYTVCASMDYSAPVTVTGGWIPTCYTNAQWDGDEDAPAPGATAVAVTVDHDTSAVAFTLPHGGEIAGSIKNSAGGNVASDVALFGADTQAFFAEPSDVSSGYRVAGLPAGLYYVCFSPDDLGAYRYECNDNASWDGDTDTLPAGATSVTVTASGKTVVNAVLTAGASISGTVTSGGDPVSSDIFLFDDARDVIGTYATDEDDDTGDPLGTYTIPHLDAGTYYVCFSPEEPYAGQCYDKVGWEGGTNQLPGGLTAITVSADQVVTGKNAVVGTPGTVSGHVTANGADVSGAYVYALTSGGYIASRTPTDEDGNYEFESFSPGKYVICVSTRTVGAAVGFQYGAASQCSGEAEWDGRTSELPSDATTVTVDSNGDAQQDFALTAAGAVTGQVTDADGNGLSNVTVRVFDADGKYAVSYNPVSTGGDYTVTGISPGTYTVCFDGSTARLDADGSRIGYVSVCDGNVRWSGYSFVSGEYDAPPAAADQVTVTADDEVNDNASLTPAGTVTGEVTDGTDDLGGVVVTVYQSSKRVADTTSGSDGTFSVTGLVTGDYTFCFNGSSVGATGYRSECYDDVAWSGDDGALPSGTTLVGADEGDAHAVPPVELAPAGAVAGTVTDSDGNPVSVSVFVFDPSGTQVGYAASDPNDGTYSVAGLAPGSYSVCFEGSSYAGECYDDVPWAGGNAVPPTANVIVTAGAATEVDASLDEA